MSNFSCYLSSGDLVSGDFRYTKTQDHLGKGLQFGEYISSEYWQGNFDSVRIIEDEPSGFLMSMAG